VHGEGNTQSPASGADSGGAPEPPGWFKSRRNRIEQRIDTLRESVEARRATSTPIAVAYDTFGRDTSTGGSVLAAALAFRIFLFYVPYIFFFVFAFGFGAEAANESPSRLARRGGMGQLTADVFSDAADLSLWTRIVTLALTGYAMFAGARGVVKVLRISYGLVWDVPVPKLRRSWRAAVLFILITTFAFVLTAVVGWIRDYFLIGGIIAMATYVIVPFGIWLIISWLLPRPADVDLWTLVPGAIVFGVGVEVLHLVTVIWIPHLVSARSDRYGPIGIALVLLFWAYILGRIMTLSAVLNAALYVRRAARLPGAPPAPAMFQDLLSRAGGYLGRWSARSRPPPEVAEREPPP
jgi:uncharacterized BrkB/YihY/UPF0761 family membrane protein